MTKLRIILRLTLGKFVIEKTYPIQQHGKRGAVGGYVITTGSFTPGAREYASGLDIELIEGVHLVELWLDGLSNAEQEIQDILPSYV